MRSTAIDIIAAPILRDLLQQIEAAGARILADALPDKVLRFDAEVERLTAGCRQRIRQAALIVAQPPSGAVH